MTTEKYAEAEPVRPEELAPGLLGGHFWRRFPTLSRMFSNAEHAFCTELLTSGTRRELAIEPAILER